MKKITTTTITLLLGLTLFGMSFVNGNYIESSAALAATSTPRPTPTPKPRSCPSTATARCNDGTCSYSQNRRGTCSHHGGVAEWY